MRKPEALAWIGLIAAVLALGASTIPLIVSLGLSRDTLYWVTVLGFTAFYGFGCFQLWPGDDPSKQTPPRSGIWIAHQFWLNGLGCFVGWMVLRFLLETHQRGGVTGGEILLGLVAFLGITGYLPFTVVGLAVAVRDLAKKVLEAATSTAKKE